MSQTKHRNVATLGQNNVVSVYAAIVTDRAMSAAFEIKAVKRWYFKIIDDDDDESLSPSKSQLCCPWSNHPENIIHIDEFSFLFL